LFGQTTHYAHLDSQEVDAIQTYKKELLWVLLTIQVKLILHLLIFILVYIMAQEQVIRFLYIQKRDAIKFRLSEKYLINVVIIKSENGQTPINILSISSASIHYADYFVNLQNVNQLNIKRN
jgi:hypothetical protein